MNDLTLEELLMAYASLAVDSRPHEWSDEDRKIHMELSGKLVKLVSDRRRQGKLDDLKTQPLVNSAMKKLAKAILDRAEAVG